MHQSKTVESEHLCSCGGLNTELLGYSDNPLHNNWRSNSTQNERTGGQETGVHIWPCEAKMLTCNAAQSMQSKHKTCMKAMQSSKYWLKYLSHVLRRLTRHTKRDGATLIHNHKSKPSCVKFVINIDTALIKQSCHSLLWCFPIVGATLSPTNYIIYN